MDGAPKLTDYGYTIPDLKLSDVGGSAIDFEKNAIDPSIDGAFNQYLMATRAQKQPLDIYSDLEGQAGLPQMRATQKNLSDQVNTLEDTLRGIEPMVGATTQNSLVTEGQRTGMVNAKRYPVQQLLDPANTALGRVSQNIDRSTADIGTKVNLALQGQQMQLDPYKMNVQLMSDRAARLMTGFTADRETTLNMLLEKIHAQQHLSDAEYQEASTLYNQKQAYDNQMNAMKAQTAADIEKQNNTYKSLGKYGLFNTSTGQVVNGGGGGGGTSGYTPSYNPNNPLGLT